MPSSESHTPHKYVAKEVTELNQTPNSEEQSNVVPSEVSPKKPEKSLKSKLLWTVVFVVIAGLTIWAIVSQDGFSFSTFLTFLKSMNPWWLIAAFASMFGYIFFEAKALLTIIRSFGYKKSIGHGMIYASGDIYFSAITPSSTGGQPASAYFMMKDKIPGAAVTVALIANLVLYTFAILIISIVGISLDPKIFFGFGILSKTLILIGATGLIGLGIAFLLILYKSHILHNIGNWLIDFLAKIKLIRKPGRKKERLSNAIRSYKHNVSQLSGKPLVLLRVLIYNILQRACGIAVTLFVFLAAGGAASSAVDVWVSQCMVVVGSNIIPIPGGMGVSDYLLIDALGAIGMDSSALYLNMLSRAISFYSCVILCGIAMIIRLITYKVIEKKQQMREARTTNSEKTDS